MIKKIVIRDVASYDSEGVVLDDLQKVNFVFGGNGTGKTTLSRVVGSEIPTVEYPGCEVVWKGDMAKVYVYNKDFRERNLRESMPGVFSLGHTGMVNELRSLEGFPRSQEDVDRKVILSHIAMRKLEKEGKRVEHELQEKLWNEVYKPHKEFKELLKGYHKKASFAERIRYMLRGKWEGNGVWSETGDYQDIEAIRSTYNRLFNEKEGVAIELVTLGRSIYEREYLEKDFWQYLALKSEKIVKKAEKEIKAIKGSIKEKYKAHQLILKEYQKPPQLNEDGWGVMNTIMPSIESINETLKINGYTGFSLQPSPENPNEFQIQREDGSYVKDTLSEGEATLISFLYFMQIVENNERGYRMRCGKVVVIDDPISSLDYAAIDLVTTLTNKLIQEARKNRDKKEVMEDPELSYYGWIEQVIVLTHNTTFHQSLSVRQARKSTRYWRLYKTKGVSRVKAFGMENPVKSDYKEMWMKLKEAIENYDSIMLPNIMRRIIETYFVDYGGYDKDDLFKGKYCKKKEDRMMVNAFAKWFDEGSHGAKDNLYSGNGEMMCERYLEAFHQLFELMGQLPHYNMMMTERP